jgi:DNA-binding NarL/FixJ family response regulator
MMSSRQHKVLIVSSHPLFSQGLRSLLQKRGADKIQIIGMVSGMDEAFEILNSQNPDLVVVDYDDQNLNRDSFLSRIICGAHHLRVVLFSLLEGGSQATVYDLKTMAAAQIDDWLPELSAPGSVNPTPNRENE